jgi:hypothetical protein
MDYAFVPLDHVGDGVPDPYVHGGIGDWLLDAPPVNPTSDATDML